MKEVVILLHNRLGCVIWSGKPFLNDRKDWLGWWGLFRGAELRDRLIKFLTLVGKEIIQNIDKDVFLAPAPNLERSENISWNMSTSRRLGAIHQLSRDRIINEFLVCNMKYEMNLSHSRRFMRSYCRWSVQNKNFGHDPSPRYRGNHGWRNKDILGGPRKVALVEIYVIFAGFAFWGF